jgi:hypothetical protein
MGGRRAVQAMNNDAVEISPTLHLISILLQLTLAHF